MTGTIKKLVGAKGFGFIVNMQGTEYFFHMSALQHNVDFTALREGDRVTFEVGQGAKGPRAEKVMLEV